MENGDEVRPSTSSTSGRPQQREQGQDLGSDQRRTGTGMMRTLRRMREEKEASVRRLEEVAKAGVRKVQEIADSVKAEELARIEVAYQEKRRIILLRAPVVQVQPHQPPRPLMQIQPLMQVQPQSAHSQALHFQHPPPPLRLPRPIIPRPLMQFHQHPRQLPRPAMRVQAHPQLVRVQPQLVPLPLQFHYPPPPIPHHQARVQEVTVLARVDLASGMVTTYQEGSELANHRQEVNVVAEVTWQTPRPATDRPRRD